MMTCLCFFDLQSMLAMWRLILGHGKPRMFAALAAQRAALAAAPRSPSKPKQAAQQPPLRAGVPDTPAAPAAAAAAAGTAAAAGKKSDSAPQRPPAPRRLWLQAAAATAFGLHSPTATSTLGSTGSKTVHGSQAAAMEPVEADRQRQPQSLLSSGDGIEMEHLIVGVLLGTPLLFLLPTTLVFHAFALLLAAGAAALQA